jgi:hypothetical protein
LSSCTVMHIFTRFDNQRHYVKQHSVAIAKGKWNGEVDCGVCSGEEYQETMASPANLSVSTGKSAIH